MLKVLFVLLFIASISFMSAFYREGGFVSLRKEGIGGIPFVLVIWAIPFLLQKWLAGILIVVCSLITGRFLK